jgi:hypothetical protein
MTEREERQQHVTQPTVKLSPFWPQAPALWFAHAECSFTVKNIEAQFDRYCHLVAALPHESLRLVADLVESPPTETPYDDIKTRFVASHQLSDFQKAERGEEKTNLFACIFLQRLPREIRVLLVRVDHKDPKELAKQADELWALHDTNGGGGGGGGVAAIQQDCAEGDFVTAVRAGDRQRGGGSRGHGRGGGRRRGGWGSGSPRHQWRSRRPPRRAG